MARTYSLIISALLVASLVQAEDSRGLSSNRKLFPRFNASPDQCSNEGWDAGILARFNGIFFGNFNAGNFHGIVGPLAVEGNFNAPNYNINTLLPTNCSDPDSLISYALVIGGNTNSFNTQVYGSVYVAGKNSSLEEITQLSTGGCVITDQQGTGLFDFDTVRKNRELASQDLAALPPTAYLNTNSDLVQVITPENPNYEVLYFNSCKGGICNDYPGQMSDPESILLGRGTWAGFKNAKLDPEKTYVLNIPVVNGTNFTVTTTYPSTGFSACKLIYNFFPVDPLGHFMSEGTFNLIRENTGYITGYILAPRGILYDGPVGNFGGNIVGKEYNWVVYNNGFDDTGSTIYTYENNSTCTEFTGCIPLHITERPKPPISTPLPLPIKVRSISYPVTRAIETGRPPVKPTSPEIRTLKSHTSSISTYYPAITVTAHDTTTIIIKNIATVTAKATITAIRGHEIVTDTLTHTATRTASDGKLFTDTFTDTKTRTVGNIVTDKFTHTATRTASDGKLFTDTFTDTKARTVGNIVTDKFTHTATRTASDGKVFTDTFTDTKTRTVGNIVTDCAIAPHNHGSIHTHYDDDNEEDHFGHHHSPDEEYNEGEYDEEDHFGHHHESDEECNEDEDNEEDYSGHHHKYDEE